MFCENLMFRTPHVEVDDAEYDNLYCEYLHYQVLYHWGQNMPPCYDHFFCLNLILSRKKLYRLIFKFYRMQVQKTNTV